MRDIADGYGPKNVSSKLKSSIPVSNLYYFTIASNGRDMIDISGYVGNHPIHPYRVTPKSTQLSSNRVLEFF
jgi:hypothetical protein